jgi:hypothetical protein
LVRDLPPKQELLLALAPTPSQFTLLQALNVITEANGRSLFRDIEVRRQQHSIAAACKMIVLAHAAWAGSDC